MSSSETPAVLATPQKPAARGRRWLLTAALLIGLAPAVVALGAPSYATTTGPSVTAWSDQIVSSHSGTSVTMQYSGVDDIDVARFYCTLDGHVQDCSGPSLALTNLADNVTHTFSIRGYDAAGHAGPVFTLKWIVGQLVVLPDTRIDRGPADGDVTSPLVTFEFSSPNNDAVTYRCWLDGQDLGLFPDARVELWFGSVSDGVHTFKVAAVDGAGRVDPDPATRTWIVDHTSTNTI